MTFYMVELPVRNLAISIAWYQSTFQFHQTRLDEPNQFVLLEGAGLRLALKQGVPAPNEIRLHFHVANLAEELAHLASVVGLPDAPLKQSDEGYRRAVLRDPDGYAISVFEWTDRAPG
jgi:predicted enzyme related to lactoylglutathione lyase